MKIKDLPEWIKTGEQFKRFQEQESISTEDEPLEVSNEFNKEDDSINSIEDFNQVLNICRYFEIPFPQSIYNYTFVDQYNVLYYLLPFRDQLEIKELIDSVIDEPAITMRYYNQTYEHNPQFVGITIIFETKHNIFSFVLYKIKVKQTCKEISLCLRNKTKGEFNDYHTERVSRYKIKDKPDIHISTNYIKCYDESINETVNFRIGRNRYILIDFFEKLSEEYVEN